MDNVILDYAAFKALCDAKECAAIGVVVAAETMIRWREMGLASDGFAFLKETVREYQAAQQAIDEFHATQLPKKENVSHGNHSAAA